MFRENTGKEERKAPDSSSKLSVSSLNHPREGSTVRDICAKFTANQVTGAGSMTVPIAACWPLRLHSTPLALYDMIKQLNTSKRISTTIKFLAKQNLCVRASFNSA